MSQKVVNDFHGQCDAITTDENGPFFGKALTFDRNELYKKRNEDLEFILIDKTEGESAAKVRKRRGEGLVAYYLLHRWFVKTTGLALQEEMKKVMNPTPVVKDELLLGHLEEWERTVSKLEKGGADYALSTMVRINALEIMMSARQSVYEAIEMSIRTDKVDQKDRLQYILTQCKQYASRRN